jgi:hypothetical protein
MRDYIKDDTGVALDREIESPALVHASLPQNLRFVIPFGVEWGMPEIFGEEPHLLVKALLTFAGAIFSTAMTLGLA